MSLLVWNCRKLENLHTETVQRRIQFKNLFEVPRRNRASGLAIIWKEDFNLEIETFSNYHIDTTINKNKDDEWRFTGFYRESDTQLGHEA